jgi:hypothetical protein
MVTLNGRTKGDLIGQFTCQTNNGASVVDYVIVSQDLLSSIVSFSVADILLNFPIILIYLSCNKD